MTAAGVVDLSLPTDRQLSAATTSDPHAAAARLMSGDPHRISLLSHAFTDSGTNVEHLHRMSGQAQRRLADSFRNNRAPIYDEATHRAALPQGFRDSGSHLQSLGRRLGAVADELHAAIADVTAALRRLQTDLDEQRRSWAAELDALGGPEGLLPPEAIAGLLAHRTTVAARMQESVTACGRAVAARIDGYNEILGGCLALLNEFTYLRSRADISGTRIDDVLRAGGTGVDEPRPGIAPLTAPTPAGPTVEIFPLPDGPRLEGTHDHPPALGGPAVDINVPAPPPETQTDRGQIPPHGSSAVHVDAAEPTVGRTPERPSRTPRVNPDQQGKHVPGHRNYLPGRSRLSADPKELLGHVGQGDQVGSIPRGQPGFRERIDFGRPIGEYVGPDGSATKTSVGIVHHRADGSVHIVPARP
jgi:hypothetical protein